MRRIDLVTPDTTHSISGNGVPGQLRDDPNMQQFRRLWFGLGVLTAHFAVFLTVMVITTAPDRIAGALAPIMMLGAFGAILSFSNEHWVTPPDISVEVFTEMLRFLDQPQDQ